MSESATSHIQPLSLSQRVANFHLYGCDATEPPYGRACSCGVWARLRLEIVTALSESATPNDWHEAQAEIHNLQRDREALRNENARRAAMFDAAIGQLVKIKGFVHPDGFIVNGKGYSFNPPIELVREAWEALSKAIREIEPPQPEARCVVGQKDK